MSLSFSFLLFPGHGTRDVSWDNNKKRTKRSCLILPLSFVYILYLIMYFLYPIYFVSSVTFKNEGHDLVNIVASNFQKNVRVV